jgi:hypothetical protein
MQGSPSRGIATRICVVKAESAEAIYKARQGMPRTTDIMSIYDGELDLGKLHVQDGWSDLQPLPEAGRIGQHGAIDLDAFEALFSGGPSDDEFGAGTSPWRAC